MAKPTFEGRTYNAKGPSLHNLCTSLPSSVHLVQLELQCVVVHATCTKCNSASEETNDASMMMNLRYKSWTG